MHRYRAPSIAPGTFFVAQSWADFIINMSESNLRQAQPLLVLGNVFVPVTPLGTGLTPGDASSVAPNGIPVGELAELVAIPSGEVSPIVGAGVAVPTCPMAMLQTKSAGKTAAINESPIGILRLQTASSRS
jgi:hypothetical protein